MHQHKELAGVWLMHMKVKPWQAVALAAEQVWALQNKQYNEGKRTDTAAIILLAVNCPWLMQHSRASTVLLLLNINCSFTIAIPAAAAAAAAHHCIAACGHPILIHQGSIYAVIDGMDGVGVHNTLQTQPQSTLSNMVLVCPASVDS
jgi:hypothetical protein